MAFRKFVWALVLGLVVGVATPDAAFAGKKGDDKTASKDAGAAATSVAAPFFLGTDTAPHAVHAKETACGCAGIFSAPSALESYVQVFDEDGALDNFEAFASLNGPAFYGLAANTATVTLERGSAEVPETVTTAEGEAVRVFGAGETAWRLA